MRKKFIAGAAAAALVLGAAAPAAAHHEGTWTDTRGWVCKVFPAIC